MSADRLLPAGGDPLRLALGGDKVARLHVVVSGHLDEIAALFKPEMDMKFTLVARAPDYPDGSRDVVVSNDTIEAAIVALRLRSADHPRPLGAR